MQLVCLLKWGLHQYNPPGVIVETVTLILDAKDIMPNGYTSGDALIAKVPTGRG